MSKMSNLHIDLSEQASELGYESLEDALNHGYVIDYIDGKLVNALEEAHKDWEQERGEIISELEHLAVAYGGAEAIVKPLHRAIKFIKGAHD